MPTATPPFCFFFNDPAPTEIYTLSLHDALPISQGQRKVGPTSCHTWLVGLFAFMEFRTGAEHMATEVPRLLRVREIEKQWFNSTQAHSRNREPRSGLRHRAACPTSKNLSGRLSMEALFLLPSPPRISRPSVAPESLARHLITCLHPHPEVVGHVTVKEP